jgi:hypothetical protein
MRKQPLTAARNCGMKQVFVFLRRSCDIGIPSGTSRNAGFLVFPHKQAIFILINNGIFATFVTMEEALKMDNHYR